MQEEGNIMMLAKGSEVKETGSGSYPVTLASVLVALGFRFYY
jgi:hypothetical protein